MFSKKQLALEPSIKYGLEIHIKMRMNAKKIRRIVIQRNNYNYFDRLTK